MVQPSRVKPLRSLIQRAHYSSVTIMKKLVIVVCVLVVVGFVLLAVVTLGSLILGGGFDP